MDSAVLDYDVISNKSVHLYRLAHKTININK